MNDLWARLEAFAVVPLHWRLPAKESAIAAAEKTIGLPFPDDFRASLLVHDGQEPGHESIFEWLPGHAPLAPLDAIVAEHASQRKRFDEIESADPPQLIAGDRLHHYFWHPKRIPIAGNEWFDQDNTYLDFFPGPSGVAGQLAMFGKGCFGVVHGPGFRTAVTLFVESLESGKWKWNGDGCVHAAKRALSWPKWVEKKLGS
jgi:cell wall assembly regulator SMI1